MDELFKKQQGRVHIILLSGGSGTRLWPLSNETRSKQFLKVLRDNEGLPESMVQRTFRMIRNAGFDVDITVAASESQRDSIKRQAKGQYELVLEPERRDTAPAILLACAHLAWEQRASQKDTVVVMPIDAYASEEYYSRLCALDDAVQRGVADLVLLGAEPVSPSEKYGYIVPEKFTDSTVTLPVCQFKEKPNEDEALMLIEHGALWNCGVFAFKLKYLMDLISFYSSARSYAELRSKYASLPKNSFDYEVVEQATNVAVVPFQGEWKDLGTWNTLTEEMAEVSSGRTVGIETCSSTHVVNELGLPLITLGLRDIMVVATPDGILVADKEQSSRIKPYIHLIAESRPMYERRRWGEYRVLDAGAHPDGGRSLVKELIIESGRQLSYQRHKRRFEVWTIVSGCGEVVVDGLMREVRAGSVIYVRLGELHAVRAIEELHIIEVQIGEDLVEDDIERLGYWWG